MKNQENLLMWEQRLTPKRSIWLSLGSVLLWWVALYLLSFIIKPLTQHQSHNTYMMFYYLSILAFFLIWYLVCIPRFLKIDSKATISYLNFLGIKGSIKGYIFALIFLVISIIQLLLLPSHLRSPLSELIWSIQPAIVEEIIFRGFILGILLKTFSKPFSITLSLLLFISIHLFNGPVGILSAAIFGLILIGIRLHTRSILPGIVVHYFVNEQILVLALPITLYCLFVIIDFFRRRMKETKTSLAR